MAALGNNSMGFDIQNVTRFAPLRKAERDVFGTDADQLAIPYAPLFWS